MNAIAVGIDRRLLEPRKGVIGSAKHPRVQASIFLEGRPSLYAHACEATASLAVTNGVFNSIEIKGSFEQLHDLLDAWKEMLADVEVHYNDQLARFGEANAQDS